jgi:hypothetical protein
MNRKQLITALIVFVVGFTVGYGFTWVLVDDPSEEDAGAGLRSKDAESESNPRADAGTSRDVVAQEDTQASPDTGTTKAADAGPASVKADASDPVPKQDAATAPKKWWNACAGRKCQLDFGGVRGGLSVRRGTIKHGTVIDWNLRFGNARRIDILPTDTKVVVMVRAVGLDSKGEPIAAEIEWKSGGQVVVGIISLQPGDKRVIMRPDFKK